MHQAPPVEYPLGNVRTLDRLVLGAWLIVVLVDLLWLYLADMQGWRIWLGLGLSLLAGAAALHLRPRAGTGTLQWDGGGWTRHDGSHEIAGELAVHLDLQSALLVAWTPDAGRASWCWLDAATDPARWLALRRALYTPQRAAHRHGDAVGPAPIVRA